MNTEQKLQRLEHLLDRVRRRASEPRLPIQRLLASDRSEVRAPERLAPPVREVPLEPVATAGAPELVPEFVPYTVVPATLELVDTPPPEALGEDDVVDEIPSDMLESVPPSGGPDSVAPFDSAEDEAEEEEEPPASSQRPRAVVMASRLLDEDREVPLKTPPPESGPQEAPLPAGLGAPNVPDVERLEAEFSPQVGAAVDPIESPFGAPPLPTPAAGPTVGQLEEGVGGRAEELDTPAANSSRSEELAAHREKTGEPMASGSGPPPAELAKRAASERAAAHLPAAAEPPAAESSAETVLVVRRPLESGVVFTVKAAEQPAPARPSTFLSLLDRSIDLGG